MEKQQETELTNMVQSSAMLLTFEGWIKYIEGFSRGLQTTKTVDATQVFDCVGEIMEYMKKLKGQIVDLFVHCEEVLEKEETCNTKINELEVQIKDLIEENKQISDKNDKLQQENAELKAALEQLAKTIKENQDGQM